MMPIRTPEQCMFGRNKKMFIAVSAYIIKFLITITRHNKVIAERCLAVTKTKPREDNSQKELEILQQFGYGVSSEPFRG